MGTFSRVILYSCDQVGPGILRSSLGSDASSVIVLFVRGQRSSPSVYSWVTLGSLAKLLYCECGLCQAGTFPTVVSRVVVFGR